MSKVVVSEFVSLDGVVEDPDGSGGTPYGGWAFRHPEVVAGDKFQLGTLLDTGVMLVGRRTWQLFSGLFPSRTDPFSTALNRIEKLVPSRSLTDVSAWPNSTLLAEDPVEEVRRRLRTQDVLVVGSASVVPLLAANDLVDEYRLMVFPVVLGSGRRLVDGERSAVDLRLVSNEDAGHGVVRLTYQRG